MNYLIPKELLEEILDELYELRGERYWWREEIRCSYQKRYNLLCDKIKQIEQILLNESYNT